MAVFGQNCHFVLKNESWKMSSRWHWGVNNRLDFGNLWVQDLKFNFIIRLLNLKLYRRLELGQNLEFWQLKDRFQAGSTVCVLCSATVVVSTPGIISRKADYLCRTRNRRQNTFENNWKNNLKNILKHFKNNSRTHSRTHQKSSVRQNIC